MNMIWGGSLYGALDPVYGVMLLKLLGSGFTVVDKSATIHFRRPGRSTLFARFVVSTQELYWLRDTLRSQAKLTRNYRVELVDANGALHAVCEKTVYICKTSKRV